MGSGLFPCLSHIGVPYVTIPSQSLTTPPLTPTPHLFSFDISLAVTSSCSHCYILNLSGLRIAESKSRWGFFRAQVLSWVKFLNIWVAAVRVWVPQMFNRQHFGKNLNLKMYKKILSLHYILLVCNFLYWQRYILRWSNHFYYNLPLSIAPSS